MDDPASIPAGQGIADRRAAANPPGYRQGFTVFFTGLSGSGKSTIANALVAALQEWELRRITLLDGDEVRKLLSSELGFSKEHRDLNIRRIGYVAAEITKHGGVAICAPIAPFDDARSKARSMVEVWGGFVLVYLSTSLAVCEGRDRKGLYAKARAGLVPNFTGISDPYEPPTDADVTIDTSGPTPGECVDAILVVLETRGFIQPRAQRPGRPFALADRPLSATPDVP
jgi:sulfate adenylyltransferase